MKGAGNVKGRKHGKGVMKTSMAMGESEAMATGGQSMAIPKKAGNVKGTPPMGINHCGHKKGGKANGSAY